MNFKSIFKSFIRQLGYRIYKPNPYSIFDFESFLYRFLATKPKINFIQIGANDGSLLDPLYQFNIDNKDKVSGFVIEPLPDLFEKLTQNYESIPTIIPVNIAIHNFKDKMKMYRVDPNKISKSNIFASGIASFDPEFYKKSKLGINQDDIIEQTVVCKSFNDFIQDNSIDTIDLLQIDTEGYDAEIIYSIDFDVVKPRIIRFEHGIRDGVMTHDDFIKLCNYLNNYGYQIIAESYDATAYLLNPEDLIF